MHADDVRAQHGFVSIAALPFFVLMIVTVGILMIFPSIATYLPDLLFRAGAP